MQAKLKAFVIHLLISLVLILAVLGLVFYLWYPSQLYVATGVASIVLLILVVDVVIGPLLTLLVYKPGKKTLVMDLCVIAMLQLGALGYGLWTLAEGRPAWIVFAGQHFEVVRKVDVALGKMARQPSWYGPEWVSVPPPLQLSYSLFGADRNRNQDTLRQPARYQELSTATARLQRAALPLGMLEYSNPEVAVAAVMKKWPRADGWLPLNASVQNMVVLLDKETAEVVAVVDLRP